MRNLLFYTKYRGLSYLFLPKHKEIRYLMIETPLLRSLIDTIASD